MEHHKKHTPPNHLKNFRTDSGYTLTDIAFLLDIKNFGRVSEWENGTSNPGIEHLITLSLIYQRLPDQIYYGLRKQLSDKLNVRKKLLQEMKERLRGSDRAG